MMRKIAVVGGGFAGLSVCWHLLQYDSIEVTLFDSAHIGGGASGVSTGLLHPFPGRLALRSWLSEEGMRSSLELIQVAESMLQRPVALRSGITRVALQPMQIKEFQERAQEDSEAVWMDNVQDLWPQAIFAPGLWIPSGVTVFSSIYLEGLWKACAEKGGIWKKMHIQSLDQLTEYDQVVLAAGDKTAKFAECASFDIQLVKGQSLLCKTQERFESSLIGIGHITPTQTEGLCQIGSTYEHGYLDEEPYSEVSEQLVHKVARFYPKAAQFEVVSMSAAVRIAPKKGYLPIVIQVSPGRWIFTGLGSRGLLYHALFGRKLAEAIALSLQSIQFS